VRTNAMSSFCLNIHRWVGVSTRRGVEGQDGYEERYLFERKRREEKRKEKRREEKRGVEDCDFPICSSLQEKECLRAVRSAVCISVFGFQ
jgi:hypothetical protein